MKYKRKKDKDFWVMARRYLHDYMPAVKNHSDKSVIAYKQSLNTYLAFLKNEKNIKDGNVTFESVSQLLNARSPIEVIASGNSKLPNDVQPENI